jgi:rRNA maturation RNase YbeY
MVSYFTQDTSFRFKEKRITSRWLKAVAESEGKKLGDISVIFCSDNYLLEVNKKYLKHDYYTDIITFDYCEGSKLSGDLFISVDSVRANAAFYETEFHVELRRVIVHGLLHLMGYDDHSDEDITQMRAKENACLLLRDEL